MAKKVAGKESAKPVSIAGGKRSDALERNRLAASVRDFHRNVFMLRIEGVGNERRSLFRMGMRR